MAIAAISFGQASSPNGCLGGYVVNASTSNTITDGTVTLFGLCEGSGCDPSVFGTTAEIGTDGRWSTDAYSSSAPEDVVPFPGSETVALIFDAPGYHQTIVFHTPFYTTSPYGKKYSQVPTVPLAPNSDVDIDGDGLYSTQEAYFGTSDSDVDTDGDGLSDLAEVFGENFIDLAGLGADPLVPDIFVEIDCMPGYCPTQAMLDRAAEVFENAPYPVRLHAILDEEIDPADNSGSSAVLFDTTFEDLKDKYFSTRRAPYFRYNIWSKFNGVLPYLGNSWIAGFVVSPRELEERKAAGIFVHELGHDLGFGHGGVDDHNCKPNYFSIMNYLYAEDGLTINGQPGVIDYSRFEAGDLDENDLDEPVGIPLGNASFSELSSYRLRVSRIANYPCGNSEEDPEWIASAATSPADWNGDGDSSDLNLQVELQAHAAGTNIQFGVIRAHDDWANLEFMTNDIGSALPGASVARQSNPETARDVLRSVLRQSHDTISNGRRSVQAVDLSSRTFDELVRRQLDAFRNNTTLYRPTGTHTCTW